MNRTLSSTLFAFACLLTAPQWAAASLVGVDVTMSSSYGGSSYFGAAVGPITATVGAGTEFSYDMSGMWDRIWTVTADFDADSVLIGNVRNVGLGTGSGISYAFSGVAIGAPIGELLLETNTTGSNVTLTITGADSFRVDVENASIDSNQLESILVRIGAAHSVPEPSTLALASLAVVGLVASRRRRSELGRR